MFSYESTHWPHWEFCARAQNLLVSMITYIMKKKGVLQLALQLNFWIIKYTCNSLYLYAMRTNGQVGSVAKL
jgi:hypothetical protein